ncbi:uncharacterized protein PHALS_01456 [Plasmopara halstedii]|uniref:Uncharacterized protein n=1 Tax=Plasmopara halstedii TaxID=4781 RepID=A0A0P1AWM2_PLAHL|nr:uncharacterized protein PHALS_01456 [Plasmopara halstedii]CEG45137.1 hypothetical protein PHALS_01456 [Plasmopara halstedii]|eukprot:XP_024581506.1 hypothetical protein PHALS_01456 [Plasmopara halstedii]
MMEQYKNFIDIDDGDDCKSVDGVIKPCSYPEEFDKDTQEKDVSGRRRSGHCCHSMFDWEYQATLQSLSKEIRKLGYPEGSTINKVKKKKSHCMSTMLVASVEI